MASQTAVDRIMQLRGMGLSYRRIAAHLDRKRIQPARAARWSAMTVRNIWEREHRRGQAPPTG